MSASLISHIERHRAKWLMKRQQQLYAEFLTLPETKEGEARAAVLRQKAERLERRKHPSLRMTPKSNGS